MSEVARPGLLISPWATPVTSQTWPWLDTMGRLGWVVAGPLLSTSHIPPTLTPSTHTQITAQDEAQDNTDRI